MAISKPIEIPEKDQALPGRQEKMQINPKHHVHGRSMVGPFPNNMEQVIFGLGCFWGAEQIFWNVEGVFTTAVGYSAGHTLNPNYREVCTGKTGHNEVVLVIYDPKTVSFQHLLNLFWESHDPTQGMRQGNDRGTQYRSGIYYTNEVQFQQALTSMQDYQSSLSARGFGTITTEIRTAEAFYYAEDYHQQYFEKNSTEYCGAYDKDILSS